VLANLETWLLLIREAELRTRLGEDAYESDYAEGRALALEDALALALRPD
jgi:hypothetical protein